MANVEELIINLKAVMDINDVRNNVNQIQNVLSKLKLPPDLQRSFSSTFADIGKTIDTIEQKMKNGFKTKSDISALEKDFNKVDTLYEKIMAYIDKIQDKDIKASITFDTKPIKEAEERIEELKNVIQSKISTATGIDDIVLKVKELQKEAGTSSKAWGNFANALQSGDLAGASNQLQNIISNMNSFKADAEKLSVAGVDVKKSIEEINAAIAAGKFEEASQKLKDFNDVIELNKTSFNNDGKSILAYAEQSKQLIAILQKASSIDISTLSTELKQMGINLEGLKVDQIKQFYETFYKVKPAIEQSKQSLGDFVQRTAETVSQTQNLDQQLGQLSSRVAYFVSLNNAVNLFKRALREAFNTVKELDAAMTETAVVTDFSVGDMWDKLPEYTNVANQFGSTIKDAYDVMTIFYQQGLDTNEAFALGTQTMQMARIAGLDYANAADKMTNALRGFNMELNETSAQKVNDVYSELAAISASDTNELATAMTKVASLANSANMEFENTAAFLAQMIETTRESAETAGTALKTVVARFAEVKGLYSEGDLIGNVDGEEVNVNKVGEALRAAGIDLNEFMVGAKGLDDILLELSGKWDSLDLLTQRYIATMAAGSRQQSRFLALMSNNARLTELTGAAYDAQGASAKQFAKTEESLATALNRLSNSWDTFLMGIEDSSVIKGVVNALNELLTFINNLTQKLPSAATAIVNLALAFGAIKIAGALLKKTIEMTGIKILELLNLQKKDASNTEATETKKRAAIDLTIQRLKEELRLRTMLANLKNGTAVERVNSFGQRTASKINSASEKINNTSTKLTDTKLALDFNKARLSRQNTINSALDSIEPANGALQRFQENLNQANRSILESGKAITELGENGKKITTVFNEEGQVIGRITQTYDEQGKIVSIVGQEMQENGRLMEVSKVQYDKLNGTITETLVGYDEEGKQIWETTAAIDKLGEACITSAYSEEAEAEGNIYSTTTEEIEATASLGAAGADVSESFASEAAAGADMTEAAASTAAAMGDLKENFGKLKLEIGKYFKGLLEPYKDILIALKGVGSSLLGVAKSLIGTVTAAIGSTGLLVGAIVAATVAIAATALYKNYKNSDFAKYKDGLENRKAEAEIISAHISKIDSQIAKYEELNETVENLSEELSTLTKGTAEYEAKVASLNATILAMSQLAGVEFSVDPTTGQYYFNDEQQNKVNNFKEGLYKKRASAQNGLNYTQAQIDYYDKQLKRNEQTGTKWGADKHLHLNSDLRSDVYSENGSDIFEALKNDYFTYEDYKKLSAEQRAKIDNYRNYTEEEQKVLDGWQSAYTEEINSNSVYLNTISANQTQKLFDMGYDIEAAQTFAKGKIETDKSTLIQPSRYRYLEDKNYVASQEDLEAAAEYMGYKFDKKGNKIIDEETGEVIKQIETFGDGKTKSDKDKYKNYQTDSAFIDAAIAAGWDGEGATSQIIKDATKKRQEQDKEWIQDLQKTKDFNIDDFSLYDVMSGNATMTYEQIEKNLSKEGIDPVVETILNNYKQEADNLANSLNISTNELREYDSDFLSAMTSLNEHFSSEGAEVSAFVTKSFDEIYDELDETAEENFVELTKTFSELDLNSPIESYASAMKTLKNSELTKEQRNKLENLTKTLFDSQSQVTEFVNNTFNSEEFQKALEKVRENGKITAHSMSQLGEEFSDLNQLFNNNEVSSGAMAIVLSEVEEGTLSLTEANNALLTSLTKLTEVESSIADSMVDLDDKNIGDSQSDAISSQGNKFYNAAKDIAKRGAYGDTQLDDYMIALLGEEKWNSYATDENGNERNRKEQYDAAIKEAGFEGQYTSIFMNQLASLDSKDTANFFSTSANGFSFDFSKLEAGLTVADYFQETLGLSAEEAKHLESYCALLSPDFKMAADKANTLAANINFLKKSTVAIGEGEFIVATEQQLKTMAKSQGYDKDKNGKIDLKELQEYKKTLKEIYGLKPEENLDDILLDPNDLQKNTVAIKKWASSIKDAAKKANLKDNIKDDIKDGLDPENFKATFSTLGSQIQYYLESGMSAVNIANILNDQFKDVDMNGLKDSLISAAVDTYGENSPAVKIIKAGYENGIWETQRFVAAYEAAMAEYQGLQLSNSIATALNNVDGNIKISIASGGGKLAEWLVGKEGSITLNVKGSGFQGAGKVEAPDLSEFLNTEDFNYEGDGNDGKADVTDDTDVNGDSKGGGSGKDEDPLDKQLEALKKGGIWTSLAQLKILEKQKENLFKQYGLQKKTLTQRLKEVGIIKDTDKIWIDLLGKISDGSATFGDVFGAIKESLPSLKDLDFKSLLSMPEDIIEEIKNDNGFGGAAKELDDEFWEKLNKYDEAEFEIFSELIDKGTELTGKGIDIGSQLTDSAIQMVEAFAQAAVDGFNSYLGWLTMKIDDDHDIEQLDSSLSNIVDRLAWEYDKLLKRRVGYDGTDTLNEKELFENSNQSAKNIMARMQNQRRLYENSFRQLEDLGLNISSELTEAFEKLYDQLYGVNGPFTRLNKSINRFKGQLEDVFPSTSKFLGEAKGIVGNLFQDGKEKIDGIFEKIFPASIFNDLIDNFTIDGYQLGDFGKEKMQKLIELFTELTPSFNADYQIANKSELVDALNQRMSTIITNDTITAQFVQGYLDYLTEVESQMESEVENIRNSESQILELYDNLTEILERGKEEYSELGQDLYTAITNEKNSLLEELQALHDSITAADEDILNTLRNNLELIRQQRENDKTEQDLQAKEARLAYLRQDTTGANLQEIKKLEKELEDGQESYTDKLIDQKISELEKQNTDAADQRQIQIDLLQEEINNTEGIWETVEKLLSGISKFDHYLTGEIDREGYKAVIEQLKKGQSYLDSSSTDKEQSEKDWDAKIRAASLYKQVKDNLSDEYNYLKLASNIIDRETGLPEEYVANGGWNNYVAFSTLETTVDKSNQLLQEAITAVNNLVEKITVSYDDEQSLHMKATYYGGLVQAVSGTESAAKAAIEDLASGAPEILNQLTEGTGNMTKGFLKLGLSVADTSWAAIVTAIKSNFATGGGAASTSLGNVGEGLGFLMEGISNYVSAAADAASLGMQMAGDMAPGITDIGVALATALKETFFNDYEKVEDDLIENIDVIVDKLGNTLGTSGYLKEIKDAIKLSEKIRLGQPDDENSPIYDALTEMYQDLLKDYRQLENNENSKTDVEGYNKLYLKATKLREMLNGMVNYSNGFTEEVNELDPAASLETLQKWRGEIGSLFKQIDETVRGNIISIVNGIMAMEGKTLGESKISRWIDIYDGVMMSDVSTQTLQRLAIAMEEFEPELSNKLYKLYNDRWTAENTPQETFFSFWSNKVTGIWGDVQDFFDGFWNKITQSFQTVVESITGKDYGDSWVGKLNERINAFIEKLKSGSLLDAIKELFDSDGDGKVGLNEIIKTIFGKDDDGNFFTKLGEFFGDLFKESTATGWWEIFKDILNSIQNSILNIDATLSSLQAKNLKTNAQSLLGKSFNWDTNTKWMQVLLDIENDEEIEKPQVENFINYYENAIELVDKVVYKRLLSHGIIDNLKSYYGITTDLSTYATGGSIRRSQTALVGEAGTELIQHARGGATLATSPSMAKLEKGDVVYNAKQTKDILKGGGLDFSRFAEGTVSNFMLREPSFGYSALKINFPDFSETNKESTFNLNLNLEDLVVDSVDRVEEVAERVMDKINTTVSGAMWPYNRL